MVDCAWVHAHGCAPRSPRPPTPGTYDVHYGDASAPAEFATPQRREVMGSSDVRRADSPSVQPSHPPSEPLDLQGCRSGATRARLTIAAPHPHHAGRELGPGRDAVERRQRPVSGARVVRQLARVAGPEALVPTEHAADLGGGARRRIESDLSIPVRGGRLGPRACRVLVALHVRALDRARCLDRKPARPHRRSPRRARPRPRRPSHRRSCSRRRSSTPTRPPRSRPRTPRRRSAILGKGGLDV